MKDLTRKDVDHIALLGRLALTDEEKEKYQAALTSVLKYAEMLNDLDLEGVPPTAHAVSQQNILRQDEVNSSLPVEKALGNAAQSQDDQFAIQAVFD